MLPFLLCWLWFRSWQLLGNKRKTNKIIPAVCGRQPWPPSWELFVLLRASPSNARSCQAAENWKHDLCKGSTREGWDCINLSFVSCLKMAPGIALNASHPLRGQNPDAAFVSEARPLQNLRPGILLAVQWKEGKSNLLWCFWDSYSPSVLAGGPKKQQKVAQDAAARMTALSQLWVLPTCKLKGRWKKIIW